MTAANAMNRMFYQQELVANPWTRPFICDNDGALKWICDVKAHIDKFDEVPERMIIKQVINTIPNPTLRLYKHWCDNHDDDHDYYELNSLIAWIRVSYPLPNTVDKIINQIKAITIRYNENPTAVFNKLMAAFQDVDQLEDKDKLKICLKCFVANNNNFKHNNVSKMNDKIRTYIADDDPRTFTQFQDTMAELATCLIPACEANNPRYKYYTYDDTNFNLLARVNAPYVEYNDEFDDDYDDEYNDYYNNREHDTGNRGGNRRGNDEGRGDRKRRGDYGNPPNKRTACKATFHQNGRRLRNNGDNNTNNNSKICWKCGRNNHYSTDCFAKFTVDRQPITDTNALPYKKIAPKPSATQLQQPSNEDDSKQSELFTYQIIRKPITNPSANNNSNNQQHSETVNLNSQDPRIQHFKQFFESN